MIAQHADILDQSESSLSRPLIGSILVHVGVVALLVGINWYQRSNATQWGEKNPMGGAIGVSAVSKIPLPNRGITPNLVANDTTSSVPQKIEKVEKKKAPKEDPDAIA